MTDVLAPTGARAPGAPPPAAARPPADDGPGFWDFVDVINPLQHIPVLNRAYRAITGDTIRPEAQLAGAAVFGGAIGTLAVLADMALEQASGRDAIGHVAALFSDDAAEPAPATPSVTIIDLPIEADAEADPDPPTAELPAEQVTVEPVALAPSAAPGSDPLPPELIADMMLMALDRYRAAERAGGLAGPR